MMLNTLEYILLVSIMYIYMYFPYFVQCSRLFVHLFVVKRLTVCEEMETSSCGSILFHAQLHPPGKTHLLYKHWLLSTLVFDSLPDLESRPHFPPLRPGKSCASHFDLIVVQIYSVR